MKRIVEVAKQYGIFGAGYAWVSSTATIAGIHYPVPLEIVSQAGFDFTKYFG
jgi:hypothetical protein